MITTIFISIFALLLGLAICFVGYRLFLVFLPIWGFFAGLYIGAMGTATLFGGVFLADITGLVVGVIVGLITGILSYLFYLVGVVIVAGVIGWIAGTGLMTAIGLEPGLVVTLVGLAFAVGFADLATGWAVAAAWLLVAGSGFEIVGGTINWLSGTGDQFAAKSLGFRFNSLVGPPAIIGILIVVVGVVRAL